MNDEPTPSDQEDNGQPAPETQPDPVQPDPTPQTRTDAEQDETGSTAPGDA
jgi:hypothetical protein